MIALITAFLGTVKHLMNGAKAPNWVKLVIICFFIAMLAIVNRASIDQITESSAAAQALETRRALAVLRRDNVMILEAIAENAAEDSLRYRRVDRKVASMQRQVDRIEDEGVETGERLDVVLRKLDRIERRR